MNDDSEARNAALSGMNAADEHAERTMPEWPMMAKAWIINFARQASEPFMIEDVRRYAYDNGLPQPPAEGAWGWPTRRAVSDGHIKFAGFQTSRNPTQHMKPCKLWVAA